MRSFIFAAGKGTRLQPITNVMPKALVPINKKPLLQHVIDKLESADCSELLINVHHHAQQIIDYVKLHESTINIKISDESEALLNTGGGLKKAGSLFKGNDPILVHNVDILSNVNLLDFYQSHDEGSVATLLVSQRETKRYLLFNESMHLVGWTNIETGEVKSPYENIDVSKCRKLAFAGIHVISPEIFSLMDTWPNTFSIIDFYLDICKKKIIKGMEIEGMKMVDVGKLDSLAQAERFAQAQNFKLG